MGTPLTVTSTSSAAAAEPEGAADAELVGTAPRGLSDASQPIAHAASAKVRKSTSGEGRLMAQSIAEVGTK
jgi:hypothetical protein